MRMRIDGHLLVLVVIAPILAGCTGVPAHVSDAEVPVANLLLTAAEADGWEVTPDSGDVDGDSPDCTGAPFAWPALETVDHASQFLDRTDEVIAVVVKRLDGPGALQVDGLRGTLAPCAPSSGELEHGAIITPSGDDSFAYQAMDADDRGELTFSNMLVACGDLLVEALTRSYNSELDQEELEQLLSPVIHRIEADQGC